MGWKTKWACKSLSRTQDFSSTSWLTCFLLIWLTLSPCCIGLFTGATAHTRLHLTVMVFRGCWFDLCLVVTQRRTGSSHLESVINIWSRQQFDQLSRMLEMHSGWKRTQGKQWKFITVWHNSYSSYYTSTVTININWRGKNMCPVNHILGVTSSNLKFNFAVKHLAMMLWPEACTVKQGHHTQDTCLLSGFTKPKRSGPHRICAAEFMRRFHNCFHRFSTALICCSLKQPANLSNDLTSNLKYRATIPALVEIKIKIII